MSRGYSIIGLEQPKDYHNIGSIMRIAGNFGVTSIYTTGKRYHKCATDTIKEYRNVPVHNVDNLRGMIPFDCIPVAVDLIDGATPLPEYEHPERAFYIFGAEDNTLGRRITDYCRDTIYIPTNECLNLSVSAGIIMYDRTLKQNLK